MDWITLLQYAKMGFCGYILLKVDSKPAKILAGYDLTLDLLALSYSIRTGGKF